MKFIKIMKWLRKMNNFNSYLAILSALDSAPIRRLGKHFLLYSPISHHLDTKGQKPPNTSLSSFVCTKIMNINILIITLMFRVAKDDHGRAGRILLPHRLVFFIQSVQVNINHALDIKLTLPFILLFILPLLNLLLALFLKENPD